MLKHNLSLKKLPFTLRTFHSLYLFLLRVLTPSDFWLGLVFNYWKRVIYVTSPLYIYIYISIIQYLWRWFFWLTRLFGWIFCLNAINRRQFLLRLSLLLQPTLILHFHLYGILSEFLKVLLDFLFSEW